MIIESWPYLHNGQYGYQHAQGRASSDLVLRKLSIFTNPSFSLGNMKFVFLVGAKWAYGKKSQSLSDFMLECFNFSKFQFDF